MPSQITHLAVAKRYLEKHPGTIKDVQAFYDGSVAPDLASNKAISHYGIRKETQNVVKYSREKVNPQQYLVQNTLDSDFKRGEFLHLVTDDEFYNVFLLHYLVASSMPQTTKDLYQTTQRDDAYLKEKYGVSTQISSYQSELDQLMSNWHNEIKNRFSTDFEFQMPYSLAALDAFVERVASFDLMSIK